jgi:hypothetical protein
VPNYKAKCRCCGWEETFLAETGEEARKLMYRKHDQRPRVAGGEHCPGDDFRLEGPDAIYRIRSGGALELIAETTSRELPLISLEELARDIFPLRDYLMHAAVRYKERGWGEVRVTGRARECRTVKTVTSEMSVEDTTLDWRVERIKGGWKIRVSGTRSYIDERGSCYSATSDISYELGLTDKEARDPEAALEKISV